MNKLELLGDALDSHAAWLAAQNETEEKVIYSGNELLEQDVEVLPCLIEPILQQVGLTALVGSSDTSKSSFLRDLSIAICTGESHYLGWQINATHRSVIYVSTEDDQHSIAYLLNKQNTDKELDSSSYESLRYIFDTDNLLEKLDEELRRKPADMVVIDAFADLYRGSPNESNQVRSFLNQYNQLAQRYHCLIIWLHHTGKRTDTLTPSKHNILGSQGFEAKMRVVMELRKDRNDSTLRHLCIVKANYLSEAFKQQSYVLKFSPNMTFSHTGERVPIYQLGVNTESKDNSKLQQIVELAEQGFTQREIADKLGYKDNSFISKALKRAREEEAALNFECNE